MIHCYNMAKLNGKTKAETLNWGLRLETSRCEYKMPLSQGYSKYEILQNVLKRDRFYSSVRVIISSTSQFKLWDSNYHVSDFFPILKHTSYFPVKWFVTYVWLKLSKSSLKRAQGKKKKKKVMDGEEVFGFLTIFSAQKSDLNDHHKIVLSLL